MQITYYGHSCFLVQIGNEKILFDPFISSNPLAKKIAINDIKPNYILLSHGHEDHVADLERIYHNTEPKVVCNFEIMNWFQKKGIKNIHPLGHGGTVNFSFGTVKMVNAIHSSSMADGSYGGMAAGYIVQSENIAFYFAGDTALHYDMKQIKSEVALDFAFLPIGDNFTMGINDAMIAADWVGAQKVIAMHYDTFSYIEINHEEVKKVAANKNKELLLMNIGETISI